MNVERWYSLQKMSGTSRRYIRSGTVAVLLGFGVLPLLLPAPDLATAASRGSECPTALEVVMPADGQVLSTSDTAAIRARFVPDVRGQEVEGSIVVVPVKGGDLFEIANGDIRSFGSSDLIEGKWYLDGGKAPAGEYDIFISAAPEGCPTMSTKVPVTVNQAPVLDDLLLVGCTSGPDGIAVTLQALVSDAEGDTVEEFDWNPGDGSDVVHGSDTFTHTYSPNTDQVGIVVAGADDWGSFLEGRTLDVDSCALIVPITPIVPIGPLVPGPLVAGDQVANPNDCGCDDMAISSKHTPPAGGVRVTSGIYCAPNAPAIPLQCQAVGGPPGRWCPKGQVAYDCNLGPISPAGPLVANKLAWNIQVYGYLHDNTRNPNQCTQGQFAQGTNTFTLIGGAAQVDPNPAAQATPAAGNYNFPGGGAFTVVAAPNRYPALGAANHGADNYTAPWMFKRHFANNIWGWLDNPGIQVNPAQDDAATQESEFVAYVRGNLATCWCRFRARHQWSRANGRRAIGGGAAPAIVEFVSGNNCRVLE